MTDKDGGSTPPERPIRWNGERPGEEPGRDHAGAFMAGTWVTSFAGFVHDDPTDPDPAPQLPAYLRDGTGFKQTSGYFATATILCLRFDGNGGLSGKVKINRGGMKLVPNDAVTGSYVQDWNDTLKVIEGSFTTVYSIPGRPDIKLNYYFIAKDWNEIEWLWMTSEARGRSFRTTVARGTLTRVRYPRPG